MDYDNTTPQNDGVGANQSRTEEPGKLNDEVQPWGNNIAMRHQATSKMRERDQRCWLTTHHPADGDTTNMEQKRSET